MNVSRQSLLAPILIALVASLLVLFDPAISDLISTKLWRLLSIEASPVRATLLVIPALAVVTVLTAAVFGSAVSTFLVLLFAAAQMNGIRLGPIDIFDIVLLIGLAAFGAAALRDDRIPVVIAPIALVSCFMLISALPHLIVQSPVRTIIGSVGLARIVLISILLVSILSARRHLEVAISALVIVGAISAAIAIVQFGLGYFAGKYFTLIDPPETAFKPTPLGFVMRASGLCITPQHLSGFLSTALPFAFWRWTTAWRLRHLLVVGLLGFGVLVSWNFSALLATGALLALFPLLRWPDKVIHTVMLYVLICVAAYYSGLFEYLFEKILSDGGAGRGVSQRETLNLLALDKLDRNLFVGTGPQGFADFSGNFWGRPVHNMLLQTTTELGLLATVSLIAGLLYLAGSLLVGMFDGDPDIAALSRLAMLALLTNVALSMSEPMMDHSNLWLFLSMIQAIVLQIGRPALVGDQRNESHEARAR